MCVCVSMHLGSFHVSNPPRAKGPRRGQHGVAGRPIPVPSRFGARHFQRSAVHPCRQQGFKENIHKNNQKCRCMSNISHH